MKKSTGLCVCVCLYVYVYMYIHVCVYICIYSFLHLTNTAYRCVGLSRLASTYRHQAPPPSLRLRHRVSCRDRLLVSPCRHRPDRPKRHFMESSQVEFLPRVRRVEAGQRPFRQGTQTKKHNPNTGARANNTLHK